MKKRHGIIIALILVLVGGLSFSIYSIYSKITTPTKPEVEVLVLEDYALNVVNSLIEGRAIEIPDELLTGVIKDSSGSDISLVITNENKIRLYFTQDIDYIGKVDICSEYVMLSYTKGDGELKLELSDMYLGEYKIPEYLRADIVDYISTEENDISNFAIPTTFLDTTIASIDLTVGLESAEVTNGSLWVTLYTDLGISNILNYFE